MRRVEAEALALEIMAEHGLLDAGWVFRFNRRKTTYGVTRWRVEDGRHVPGWVELSGPLVDVNDAAMVEGTVRHEVAHALAGQAAGHGPGWRAACRVTGARPEVCGQGVAVKPRWVGVCPGCGEVRGRRHRRTERMARLGCGPCARATGERHMLRWTATDGVTVEVAAQRVAG